MQWPFKSNFRSNDQKNLILMTKFTVPFPSQLDVRWMGLWCGEIFYLSEFLFLITNPTGECTHIDILRINPSISACDCENATKLVIAAVLNAKH